MTGPKPKTIPGSPNGFTLIEIMVVVGILGLVLAMGMPPFIRSLKKDPLQQAISDIEEGCTKARALAILHGVPAEFIVRSDGQLSVAEVPGERTQTGEAGGFRTGSASQSSGVAAPTFSAHFPSDVVGVRMLYVNLKDQLQSAESHVRFYPNGTSDEFTVVLETGRAVRKLSLECVTGLPRVEVIQ